MSSSGDNVLDGRRIALCSNAVATLSLSILIGAHSPLHDVHVRGSLGTRV